MKMFHVHLDNVPDTMTEDRLDKRIRAMFDREYGDSPVLDDIVIQCIRMQKRETFNLQKEDS
jgi:hypothetical protein